jgi:hypothetical protein
VLQLIEKIKTKAGNIHNRVSCVFLLSDWETVSRKMRALGEGHFHSPMLFPAGTLIPRALIMK